MHSEVNPSLNDNAEISLKPKEDGVLVNVPVELWINNKTLEKGYYKVLAERAKDGKIIIKLYQSQFLKAEFPMYSTPSSTTTFLMSFLYSLVKIA